MGEIQSFCTLCGSQCGTINVVENDRLVSVRNDPSHPTGHAVCPKGRAGPEIVAANNRILYPMRRTRPKTDPDPGWVRISWDEALDLCTGKLLDIRERYGAEGVAFAVTTKSGTGIADSIEWIDRFVRLFGSPNIASSTDVCNWHRDVAHRFTFGVGMPTADYAHAELIILWGHNPTSTWLAQADAIARGRANGAAMIVVDPRATPLAIDADVWLQVRPGTDAALALGVSNLLIREGGADLEFLRQWTNAPMLVRESDGLFLRARDLPRCEGDGTAQQFVAWDLQTDEPYVYDTNRLLDIDTARRFALTGLYEVPGHHGQAIACRPAFDHFRKACAAWTPERVEQVTGVPREKLKAAASLMASQSKIAYHAWTGIGQSSNATQTERAVATLYALRGSFDEIGGNRILGGQPANKVDSAALLVETQSYKTLGRDIRPIGPAAEGRVKPLDVYRAIVTGDPYPIRALVGFGSNHLLTQGNTDEIRRGLEVVDFYVHSDIVETPVARYADVLLPASTPWEREGLRIGFGISEAAQNLIQLRPAVLPPRGEARSDLEIVFALAERLGMGDKFFHGDIDAGWNYMLAPLGITVQDLRANDGKIIRPIEHAARKYARVDARDHAAGFQTETRRVEFYSELLLRNRQSPVPVHVEEDVDRSLYPFTLISMKTGVFCHSQHRGIASLRRRASRPTIRLHGNVARLKNISDGHTVEVTSRHGSTRFVAEIDNTLASDVLAADFGWWEACEPLGKQSYALTGSASSNFNSLVSAETRDPVSGSVNHRAVACNVRCVGNSTSRSWQGFRRFTVSRLHPESDSALAISLLPQGADTLPDYEPGQYLRLRVTHPSTGALLTRAYSLTGATGIESHSEYKICVGRALAGAPDASTSLSLLIHETLKEGDTVGVEAPSGTFTMPTISSVPLILIATGIGITPFMSLLNSLDGDRMPPVTLLYGNRNGSEHAFKHQLRALAKRLPRLTVRTFYGQPRGSDIQGIDFDVRGRLDGAQIDASLVEKRSRFYICGSDAMVASITRGLVSFGVPNFDIYNEVFVSPTNTLDKGLGPCSVSFKRSGISFQWGPKDGTLLECAERLGIRAPSGCRVGQCESCAVRVLAGSTRQLSGAVPEDSDTVFTCRAVPCSDLVLDI
ncbi:molybdopterin-dependent oxidoreductase [Bradyrhizobium pachyrhizi]|uniref:Molybdopterin-dependent oxidoreductase n=1 Tax=Bradyrhizobium pachyrhizi TaxID=280333 RepID=A0A844SKD4_9BRAD|nr:molybdopterin-dependent oxidoreductase [Bradyrhizobium pachyrhizi]MVT63561.1 molybdopterin-dependent oxidoreductase [Bradyrhizobium pachyrhizi]